MIVCVTGGKGGPGATVLAANLAIALARAGKRCLLLDLDPFGGDVSAYIDPERLDPSRGLLPLLRLERAGIGSEALARESQTVAPGLSVLLGSLRPATDLITGRTADVLRAAQPTADVVVADLGRTVSDSPTLAGLLAADRCLLAARPDLQGALAAERALSVIDDEIPVEVVATRVGRRRAADVAELSEALGREIATSVPELRSPVSLTPKRHVRRALARMVQELSEEKPSAARTAAPVAEVAAS